MKELTMAMTDGFVAAHQQRYEAPKDVKLIDFIRSAAGSLSLQLQMNDVRTHDMSARYDRVEVRVAGDPVMVNLFKGAVSNAITRGRDDTP